MARVATIVPLSPLDPNTAPRAHAAAGRINVLSYKLERASAYLSLHNFKVLKDLRELAEGDMIEADKREVSYLEETLNTLTSEMVAIKKRVEEEKREIQLADGVR